MGFKSEQIFIVTGASSGLGKSTALMLNEQGAKVVAIARNEVRLNKMKEECKYPDNMYPEIKDLTEDIENLPLYVKSLSEKYGRFSGMAYCAGVTSVVPLRSLDLQEAKNIFDINYFAPVFMLKGFANKKVNIGDGTSIVVISSIAGLTNAKGMTIYNGTKSALFASIKTISREVADKGVRVNVVSPSDIDTPMTQNELFKPLLENRMNLYPFGLGKPDDVANMIVYLLSDKAKFISGQNYIIDSGIMY